MVSKTTARGDIAREGEENEMASYGSLRDGIIKEAEGQFGLAFDNRSRVTMCRCLSGGCVEMFEERIQSWFKKKTKTIALCATKGHKFQAIQKCQRCGIQK